MASVTGTQKTPDSTIHQGKTMNPEMINTDKYKKFEVVALAVILALAVGIGAVAGISSHSLVVGLETGASTFAITGTLFVGYLYFNLQKDLRTQREAANSQKGEKYLCTAADNSSFRELDTAIGVITEDLKKRHPHLLVDAMHEEIRELAKDEQKLQFRKDAAKLGAFYVANKLVWDGFQKTYLITTQGLPKLQSELQSEIENDLQEYYDYSPEFIAENKQLIVIPSVTVSNYKHPKTLT